MLAGTMFWATVLVFATFYFGGVIAGLEVGGQVEAELANRVVRLFIVVPALTMFLRDALKLLRR